MRSKRISKITVLLLSLILVFGISAQSTVAYLVAESDEITNTFKPIKTPVHDINVKVSGEKKIDGRDWNDKDAYTLILQVKADDPNTNEIEWSSVGNVSVDMDNKAFDLTDQIKEAIKTAGEHHFRVMEKQETVENMTFDDAVYEFKITTVADAEGNLSVSSVHAAKGDINNGVKNFSEIIRANGIYDISMVFTNVYTDPGKPPVTDASITVIKKMEYINVDKGEKIGAGGFEFVLEPLNGNETPITVKTNDAGTAEFKLSYDDSDVGTHSYKLVEVNGNLTGVTYDDTEYRVAVEVVKDNNKLTAAVKCNGKEQSEYEFTNIFDCKISPDEPTKPSDPTKPSGPAKDDESITGDDANIFLNVALMIVSGVMIMAILIDRRRRQS